MERWHVVAVAVQVAILAFIGFAPFDGTETELVDDRDVSVRYGSLPEDPNVMFDRVETLTGYDGRGPGVIEIRDPGTIYHSEPDRSTLDVYLGFETTDSGVLGVAHSADRIALNASMGPAETEHVLAHELHHVIWLERDPDVYVGDWEDRTTEEQFLTHAMREGAAVFVQQRYWQEYVKPESYDPAAHIRRDYRNDRPGDRWSTARYYYGYRYVASRIDSARNLTDVYHDPPRTTEELIHRLPPGSEWPSELPVESRPGEHWTHDPLASPDTRGELFLRLALQVGVNDSAAARGADGWGNDELVAYLEEGHEEGFFKAYVWVLRFDDAANATEFRRVFDAYLTNRGHRNGSVWTVQASENGTVAVREVAVDDRTVAVAFGPRPFAANATVDVAPNGTITVEPP